jgi:hypothetical protein
MVLLESQNSRSDGGIVDDIRATEAIGNSPPFTAETAARKIRAAEDAWNTRDPARVALAYTEDSV